MFRVFRSAQEKKPSRLFYIPWLAFLPLYIIYESAINVYFFYMAFSARLENRDAFILRPYGVSAPVVIFNMQYLNYFMARMCDLATRSSELPYAIL